MTAEEGQHQHHRQSQLEEEETVSMAPRKLNVDDDDDDDMGLLKGGPFENAKRKNSWSATTLRKELGSPRMAPSDNFPQAFSHGMQLDYDGTPLVAPQEPQQQLQPYYHPPPTASQNYPKASFACSSSSAQKKERTCVKNVGTSFLQELGSALVSCGGGAARGGKAKHGSASELMDVTTSWVRLKDTFAKAVNGDLDAAKDAWKKDKDTFNDAAATAGTLQQVPSQDSILTYDNQSVLNHKQAQLIQQEEEALQLRRLTSWGTVGTYETAETYGTGPSKTAMGITHGVVEDDDGIPIDVHLLQTRGKKIVDAGKQKHTETRRKRVVRFDYPPISSLRECPRTQPDQIENLFFTEHELEQIEDDRYSTISADDVEIVAISTSTTAESETGEDTFKGMDSNSSNDQSGDLENKNSGNLVNSNPLATAKHKKDPRKGRKNFSFDDGRVGAPSGTHPKTGRRRRSANDSHGSSKGSPSANSASSRRMIKSVQIYLRERSVG